MTKETRKRFNQMVKDLNGRFPAKEHGFKKIRKLVLHKDSLEIVETIYTDKGKVESKKVIAHLLTPENKSNYTWEDVLSAGLKCAGLPLYIFDTYQREEEELLKEMVKKAEEKSKLDKIADNLQSHVIEDAEFEEVADD